MVYYIWLGLLRQGFNRGFLVFGDFFRRLWEEEEEFRRFWEEEEEFRRLWEEEEEFRRFFVSEIFPI